MNERLDGHSLGHELRVSRFVRQDFDHRRDWIEHRLADLAEIFAVSIWSYAVMSNHVHAVIEIRAEAAQAWSAEVVAQRWLRLYPSRGESDGKPPTSAFFATIPSLFHMRP